MAAQLSGSPHPHPMSTKSILASKTFWIQLVAVVSLAVPAVRGWLDENPVEFVAVFAALNVLVRFVTSGKINIFGDSGSKVLPLLALVGTLAVLGGLPACSNYPLTGSVAVIDGKTGSKAGLDFTPGQAPRASLAGEFTDANGNKVRVDLSGSK